jgi:ABC-type branched-subunit amino acid transport system substrate-binding protein
MVARGIIPTGWRCLLACLFLAPLAAGAGARPVTLGLVAPPGEADAASLLRGVQLAVADANTADAPVALEVRSESGQWGSVGNDAVTLVCERHVDAIIAPADGAATHLILQVSGRTRVPVAGLCSDSSVTEAGVPWAVRVVPRTDLAAGVLFAAVRQPDRAPLRWWAFVPPDRPGRVIRRDLETAARVTATPLDRIVESGDPKMDTAALAHTIVAAAPGGALLWLPPAQAGTVAAALRAAGYVGRLAGPGSLHSPEFVAAAGAAANGVLVAEFRPDADSRSRAEQLENRFRRRYDVQPDFTAAAGYDAARVLIETLRRAEAGAGYRQFPLAVPVAGVTGVLHFDPLGNRTDPLLVLTCRDGRFVPIPPAETY